MTDRVIRTTDNMDLLLFALVTLCWHHSQAVKAPAHMCLKVDTDHAAFPYFVTDTIQFL